jgi:hypothetical protein
MGKEGGGEPRKGEPMFFGTAHGVESKIVL